MEDHAPKHLARLIRRRMSLALGGASLGVVLLGILIWARLILITGHPRTAIADPEANPPAAAADHSPADPARDAATPSVKPHAKNGAARGAGSR